MKRKITTRMQERTVMLRRLVAELRKGDLARDAAAEKLGVSDSGVRNYLADLLRAGLIESSGRTPAKKSGIGMPVFRLVADEGQTAEFFERAALPPRQRAKAEPRSKVARATASGRHIHLMADDAPFLPKLHHGVPAPDPYALPAAFFSVPSRATSGSIIQTQE